MFSLFPSSPRLKLFYFILGRCYKRRFLDCLLQNAKIFTTPRPPQDCVLGKIRAFATNERRKSEKSE